MVIVYVHHNRTIYVADATTHYVTDSCWKTYMVKRHCVPHIVIIYDTLQELTKALAAQGVLI